MANSRIMLVCKHCGEDFCIGQGYFGSYVTVNEAMFEQLNDFFKKHEYGCCSNDTDCSDNARNHFAILEEGEDLDVITADVAPRAEVANKICCEIEEEIVAALESNYRALKEWDDGRCNDYILEMVNRIKGKIDALRGIEAFVEELKNKYAEVQK